MDNKLYKMMNWPKIEGIEYCDQDDPGTVLGPHLVKEGLLIQAYVPDAVKVQVRLTASKKTYDMEKMDDQGLYAVLIDSKSLLKYKIIAEYDDSVVYEYWDAYEFDTDISESELHKFNAGINYSIYNTLGSHVKKINNIEGVQFAVWAPFALRVSVVGEFNNWDGRLHQMNRIGDTGVFALFVPGVKAGQKYKFEIKVKGDQNIIKCDPYAYCVDSEEGNAAVVVNDEEYKWSDTKWMNSRKNNDSKVSPVSIYELSIPSWIKEENKDFTLSEKILKLVEYVDNMNYTHVEIMPVTKGSDNDPLGYQTEFFYSVDEKIGSVSDIKRLINEFHNKGIGVILDWAPNHFASDEQGIKSFDGSCLYEHEDIRKGVNPRLGTYLFNYGRPEVTNYLIANALYWVNEFHVDGIKINSVASMLYLDYDRNPGEWVANIYGGNENLDAIEFFKHLNSIFSKKTDGVIVIAEDNSGYPQLTGDVSEECMGFTYKLNEEWEKDLIDYMGVVPYQRKDFYNDISLSMVYQYSDNYILAFDHLQVSDGKASTIGKMTGDTEERKFANLRAAYGYMYVHPGKKMMFMGQDFAQYESWDAGKALDWKLLEESKHQQINDYIKDLNKLYKSEPALYELDNYESGFEWINNISARESIIVFARKGKKADELILVVCNFDDVDRADYKIGVPSEGKYKEIFNSDNANYGGNGFVNPRLKQSKTDECDGRPESIRINVPALGITVLKYLKADEKVDGNKSAKSTAKRTTKSTSIATKAIKEEKTASKTTTSKTTTRAKRTTKATKPTKATKATKTSISSEKTTKTSAAITKKEGIK